MVHELTSWLYNDSRNRVVLLSAKNNPIGWESLKQAWTASKPACQNCNAQLLLGGESDLIKKVPHMIVLAI